MSISKDLFTELLCVGIRERDLVEVARVGEIGPLRRRLCRCPSRRSESTL